MHSKYYLTEEIKPNIDTMGNVAFTNDDVLFDWTAFEIPKGTAALVSFTAKMAGVNGTAQKKSFDVFFAQSINGVAPPTFGDSNDAKSVIKAQTVRPYIIGYQRFIPAADGDTTDSLIGYNILGNGQGSDNGDRSVKPIILQGDPDGFPGDSTYSKTTPGYQTIFIAATITTADFGTGVNIAGENAAGHLTIDVDGVDADDIFAVGDTVIAFDADGSGATLIGDVTALTDAVVTVDAAPNIIADDDELCNRNPVTLRFGFEY
jgi:hypothetical protein